MQSRVYLVDIDGTLCQDVPNEEAHRFPTAQPLPGARDAMQALVDAGHELVYFTARLPEHAEVTRGWLGMHGFPFPDSLLCGKPRSRRRAYVWVDNTPVSAQHFAGDWAHHTLF